MGQVAAAAGRLHDAQKYHTAQLEQARAQGDRFFEGSALQHLGELALRRGDLRLARVRLVERIVTSKRVEAWPRRAMILEQAMAYALDSETNLGEDDPPSYWSTEAEPGDPGSAAVPVG